MTDDHGPAVNYSKLLFLPEYDVAYSRWTPPVSQKRMSAGFDKNLAQGTFNDGVRVLIDFSKIARIEGTLAEMQALIRRVNSEGRGLINRKLHVFFAPDMWVYGDVRRYQTLANAEAGIIVEVCKTEREALAILDIEHATFDELFQSTQVIDLWTTDPI